VVARRFAVGHNCLEVEKHISHETEEGGHVSSSAAAAVCCSSSVGAGLGEVALVAAPAASGKYALLES
jgi:microcompartment protein CcmK/EutM